jgi:hypothetical protein
MLFSIELSLYVKCACLIVTVAIGADAVDQSRLYVYLASTWTVTSILTSETSLCLRREPVHIKVGNQSIFTSGNGGSTNVVRGKFTTVLYLHRTVYAAQMLALPPLVLPVMSVYVYHGSRGSGTDRGLVSLSRVSEPHAGPRPRHHAGPVGGPVPDQSRSGDSDGLDFRKGRREASQL